MGKLGREEEENFLYRIFLYGTLFTFKEIILIII